MYVYFNVKYILPLVIPLIAPLVEASGVLDDVGTTTEILSTTETEDTPESSTEFPYQVSTYISVVSLHYSYNNQFICGGSIISSKIVITAAHCMYYKWGGLLPPIIVTISAGRRSLNESAWRTFDVANISLHPSFNKTTMEYNLALLEINSEFPTNDLVGKVSMEKYIPEVQYNNCIVTGWNQFSYSLEIAEVNIVRCDNYPDHICTYKRYENDSVCISDAGNPLVCDGKLVGVLSVEPDCGDPTQPTIFENIRNSMSWLSEFDMASSKTKSVSCVFLLLPAVILIRQF